jgi:hypothetical protein
MKIQKDWRICVLEGTYFAVYTTLRGQTVRDFATLEKATKWLEEQDALQ